MSDKSRVLVLTDQEFPQFAGLRALPHVIGGEPSAFMHAAKDAAVILNWSGSRDLLQPVFSMCRKLRWVHSRSAGVDNLLFAGLVDSDVVLTNGSGVFSASLGEFVLAAILYFAKDLRRMLDQQSAGRWEQFNVEEIAGKTVGIVGYGDIGRAVASRVRAMGMNVLALKRRSPQTADPLVQRFYKPEERREMIAKSDYVVATAPLTRETYHMISGEEFAAMKPDAVIINVGRGPVIDEAALVRAVTAERIRGAALDVFEDEPLPTGHALYGCKNVLLSPHCADHTAEWENEAMCLFLEQYERFENGEPLKNIVDKRRGY